MAAAALSKGSGEGFLSHQGAPRVDCVGFTAVWSSWSSIKIREHREGLRPMDCSSLPSSRDNLEPIKGIKSEEEV